MKKKIRKNTQLSLLNLNRAGRPSIHDKGIRHISREKIAKPTALHLTIKVRDNKADIQSKRILRALHHAIKRARLKQLRVIHYTLEFNHVHLLVEVDNNKNLHRGMQALGISLSKAINKIKSLKGSVYKHRYHFRKLSSRREVKNVIHYIFGNGVKHKRTKSLIDPFNSLVHEKRISADVQNTINKSCFLSHLKGQLSDVLCEMKVFYIDLQFLWEKG